MKQQFCTASCDMCGTTMRTRTDRISAKARCQQCRAAMRLVGKSATCIHCGREFVVGKSAAGKFCSNACVGAHRHAQHVAYNDGLKPYFVRRERDNRAPGLTNWQRRELLKRWMAVGMQCAYCGELASTIDHVMPLVRGGTNREGNLVPACRSCNSAKGPRTVTEWKYGKPAAHTIAAEWKVKPRRKPGPPRRRSEPVPVQTMLNICPECGALCINTYCGALCAGRYGARAAYRRKVGIPVDAPPKRAGRPRMRVA